MTALPCPPELWEPFSRLLDAALELPATQRPAWLAGLAPEQAPLRPYLESVLASPADALGHDVEPGPDWLPYAAAALAARPEAGEDELHPGDRVGPYTLLAELGRGGMGTVWRAARSDGAYQREVALKLPHPDLLAGESTRHRFRRERDILARLAHPNIAQLLDAGVTADGQPYLALELVDGEPITDACRARRSPLAERIALVRQVIEALRVAHARLVVHRDIKPSNVLVTADGRVRLLDFGIAKLLEGTVDAALSTRLTQAHVRLATPDYAAPEQLAGGEVTVATDVFATGVLLFELVTGRRPFRPRPPGPFGSLAARDPAAEAPRASASVAPEVAAEVGGLSPRNLARALAGDLDAILAKALAVDPAERYDSIAALGEDLDRFLGHQPIVARRASRRMRAAKFLRRHRLGAAMSAALALAVGLGIAGVLRASAAAAREARRANATKEFLLSVFTASDPRVTRDRPRGEMPARELLDIATGQLEDRLVDDPETRSKLLSLAATIYSYLDDLPSARRLARRNTEELAARLAASDPRLIEAKLSEAWLAIDAGELEDAERRLAELDLLIVAAGDGAERSRAEWWLARSDVAGARGDPAQREGLLRAAVAAYERVAPREAGYGAALSDLGLLLYRRGELASALLSFDRAFEVEVHADASAGVDLAKIQGRRGQALLALGRTREAIAAFAEARRRFASTVGLDYPASLVATAGLAQARCRAGDLATGTALLAEVDHAISRLGGAKPPWAAEIEILRRGCPAAAAVGTSRP